MTADDVLKTGKYRYRFYRSPTFRTAGTPACCLKKPPDLFCSDLFHHFGNVDPVTSSDLIEPTRKAMQQLQQGPLAGYMPYTRQTEGVLRSLAELKPQTLAVMHGSSYIGPSGPVAHGPRRCDQGKLQQRAMMQAKAPALTIEVKHTGERLTLRRIRNANGVEELHLSGTLPPHRQGRHSTSILPRTNTAK
jgi:hypothetical protein